MNNGKIDEPFTPILDDLAREVGLIKAAVIGSIWRFTEMERGVCFASHQKIGERCGLERSTVRKAVTALVADGLVIDHTPDRQNAPHDLTISGDYIPRFGGKTGDVIPTEAEAVDKSGDLIRKSGDVIPTERKSGDLIRKSGDVIPQRKNKRQLIRDNKETAVAPTAFEIYENEIGALTQISRDLIIDYCNEYSEDWFIRALRIAVAANKRNLRYIGGILKKWKAQGGPQHDGPRKNGAKNEHSQADDKDAAAAVRKQLIADIEALGLVPDLRFSGT